MTAHLTNPCVEFIEVHGALIPSGLKELKKNHKRSRKASYVGNINKKDDEYSGSTLSWYGREIYRPLIYRHSLSRNVSQVGNSCLDLRLFQVKNTVSCNFDEIVNFANNFLNILFKVLKINL